MAETYKRHFRNYLINKNFQVKFFLRFFVFSFLMLTIGTAMQYHYATKTILENISTLSGIVNTRQKELIDFLNTTKFSQLEAQSRNVTPNSSPNAKLLKAYTDFVKKEVNFRNKHMEESRALLRAKLQESVSTFFVSFLVVGVFFNFILSFVYGLFLSHNIAGNHYRLKLFAKQIQDRDLTKPLVVRNKDFFSETAHELEKARKIIQEDLKSISTGNEQDIIKKYTLETVE